METNFDCKSVNLLTFVYIECGVDMFIWIQSQSLYYAFNIVCIFRFHMKLNSVAAVILYIGVKAH